LGRATPGYDWGRPLTPGWGKCARPSLYDEQTDGGLALHMSQFRGHLIVAWAASRPCRRRCGRGGASDRSPGRPDSDKPQPPAVGGSSPVDSRVKQSTGMAPGRRHTRQPAGLSVDRGAILTGATSVVLGKEPIEDETVCPWAPSCLHCTRRNLCGARRLSRSVFPYSDEQHPLRRFTERPPMLGHVHSREVVHRLAVPARVVPATARSRTLVRAV
jgi:hypothetical protein